MLETSPSIIPPLILKNVCETDPKQAAMCKGKDDVPGCVHLKIPWLFTVYRGFVPPNYIYIYIYYKIVINHYKDPGSLSTNHCTGNIMKGTG